LFNIVVAEFFADVSGAFDPTVYWPGLVPSTVLFRYQFAESTAFCKLVLFVAGGGVLLLLLQDVTIAHNDRHISAAMVINLNLFADFMIADFY
jgi:hypothetical protein